MKKHIEASQKEEAGDRGKKDDNRKARDRKSMPAVALSFLRGLLCCRGSKTKRPKLDENGEASKRNEEERAEGSGRQIAITKKKEPVQMSFDVWYDVHQFITREEMAERVSLACYGLKELCWPRLHGRKMTPYMVERLSLGREWDGGRTKAVLWKEGVKKIPIAANSPLPAYVQGFKNINILYLDSEQLQFMRNISPLLATVYLFVWRINNRTLHNLRNLLDALNGCSTIACLHIPSSIPVSISKLRQQCPGLLENIPAITLSPLYNNRIDVNELILAKLESSKSFVMDIRYWPLRYLSIKEAFHTAKQRQSFLIILDDGPGLEVFQLANEETGEVLALERLGNSKYELYRCPRGEVEQWREEARKLLKKETYQTRINYHCLE